MAFGGIITAELRLNSAPFNSGIKAAQASVNAMGSSTSTAMGGMQQAVQKTNAEMTRMSQNMKAIGSSAKGAFPLEQIQKQQQAMQQLSKQVQTASTSFAATGRSFTPMIANTERATSAFSKMQTGISGMGQAMNNAATSFVSFDIWMAGLVAMMAGQWSIGNAMDLERSEKFFQFTGMSAGAVKDLSDNTKEYAQTAALVNTPELLGAWRLVRMDVALTADQMKRFNPVMGDIIALFKLQGRTATDAGLAIEDALGSDSWKRFKELGIKKEDVVAAGWSGDTKDVEGFYKALEKLLGDKGLKGIANDTSSVAAKWENLKEKFTNAGIAIGTALLPVIESLVGALGSIMGVLGPLNTGLLVFGTATIFTLGLLYPILSNIAGGFGTIGRAIAGAGAKLLDFVGMGGQLSDTLTDFAKKKKDACSPCDVGGGQVQGGMLSNAGSFLTTGLAGPLSIVVAGLIGVSLLEVLRRSTIQDAVKNLPPIEQEIIYKATNTPPPIPPQEVKIHYTEEGKPEFPTWQFPTQRGFPNVNMGNLLPSWLQSKPTGEQTYQPAIGPMPSLDKLSSFLSLPKLDFFSPASVQRADMLAYASRSSGIDIKKLVPQIGKGGWDPLGFLKGGDKKKPEEKKPQGKGGFGDYTGVGVGFGMPNWKDMAKGLKDAQKNIEKIAGDIKNHLHKIWDSISNQAKQIWSKISSSIKTVWNTIWNGIKGVVDKIRNGIITGFQAIIGPATQAWNSLKSGVTSVINTIRTTVLGIVDKVRQGVIDGFNAVYQPAFDAWTSVYTAVAGPVNEIINLIGKLKSLIGAGPAPAGGGSRSFVSHLPYLLSGRRTMGAAGPGLNAENPGTTMESLKFLPRGMKEHILRMAMAMNPRGRRWGNNPYNIGDSSCCAGGDTLTGAIGNAPQVWPERIISWANQAAANFFGIGNFDIHDTTGLFMAFIDKFFSEFSYQFYFDSQKGVQHTIGDKAGNCSDMADVLCAIAAVFGIPCSRASGTWDGVGHIFNVLGNGIGNLDPTAKVTRGSFTASPSFGPVPIQHVPKGWGHKNKGGDIHIHGDVYGFDDFSSKVEKAMDKRTQKYRRQGVI